MSRAEGSRMTLRPEPYDASPHDDAVYDALEELAARGDPATLAFAWLSRRRERLRRHRPASSRAPRAGARGARESADVPQNATRCRHSSRCEAGRALDALRRGRPARRTLEAFLALYADDVRTSTSGASGRTTARPRSAAMVEEWFGSRRRRRRSVSSSMMCGRDGRDDVAARQRFHDVPRLRRRRRRASAR